MANLQLMFRCEDCGMRGFDEDDLRSYARCPECDGQFIRMTKGEIEDYQHDREAYDNKGGSYPDPDEVGSNGIQ